MSKESFEVVRGLYDSFGRGDVPAVLNQMDEAIEWAQPAQVIPVTRTVTVLVAAEAVPGQSASTSSKVTTATICHFIISRVFTNSSDYCCAAR